MAGSFKIVGGPEFDAKLDDLQKNAKRRIAKNTISAGARAVRKEMKKLAPDSLKQSIGMDVDPDKFTAKIGPNVGKRSRIKWVQWATTIVIGTAQRFRKVIDGLYGGFIKNPTQQQLSTGQIKAKGFVAQARANATGSMNASMKASFDRSVAREVAKAKLNKGK